METTAWRPLPRHPPAPSLAAWPTSGRRWAGRGRDGFVEAEQRERRQHFFPSCRICSVAPASQLSVPIPPARPTAQLRASPQRFLLHPERSTRWAALLLHLPLPCPLQNVVLEATLLKPQMCIPGADYTGEKPTAVGAPAAAALGSAYWCTSELAGAPQGRLGSGPAVGIAAAGSWPPCMATPCCVPTKCRRM